MTNVILVSLIQCASPHTLRSETFVKNRVMAEYRSAQAPRHEGFIAIPNMPCPIDYLTARMRGNLLLSDTQFAFPSNVYCCTRLDMLNMQYSK